MKGRKYTHAYITLNKQNNSVIILKYDYILFQSKLYQNEIKQIKVFWVKLQLHSKFSKQRYYVVEINYPKKR